MSVKPRRHLAKAITWRIVASLTTFVIGWIVTGSLDFGMANNSKIPIAFPTGGNGQCTAGAVGDQRGVLPM